ncbi:putative glucose-methanol-choline oxidoreductase, cellobiose dehydrogenase, cytochrome [Septoria linicola]|nr:putative glucose-methanol-choline oxidoreductase, cellobiose dehydrogenase, cytochrome [Septoria linicola]
MKFPTTAAALAALTATSYAQVFSTYTDDDGIVLWQNTWDSQVGAGNAQWGLALPPADAPDYTNEYIGRVVAPIPESGTWLGISHSSGMTSSLILLTWVNDDEVMTSFRYASGYVEPDVYKGNASLSVISSFVNETHYGLTYRCEDCWAWDQDGVSGSQVPKTTSAAAQLMGWAQATTAPTNPQGADAGIVQHAADGIMAATVGSARNTQYTEWLSLATATSSSSPSPTNGTAPVGTGTGGGSNTTATATSSASSAACTGDSSAITSQTWDYIVVGSGAGGIPVADRLSESGASVLLIEKGSPSSGRWNGTLKPEWLEGTNLTRFDVPGLDNQIWVDSDGIACTDVAVMAGCVLGGGTAVNAGLWWKANPTDLDYNFPEGWKSADMEAAVERTFDRIPFTDVPSQDGIIYQGQGYDVVAGALAASGWKNVTADEVPAEKNLTFSRPNHMFSGGERGGPMATYLVSASERDNFKLVTGTSVARVVRDGSTITGVEVEAFLEDGICGTINAKNVILSAGAFGTPKILFRSGIGPQDQLEIVSKAEGDKMVNSSDWINLPVGQNLDDHTSTDIVVTHPNITTYDFYGAYSAPIEADMNLYLDSRSGILAQSAPNLVANFWQEVEGADGITRQLHYTARIESSHDVKSNKSISITQYLGRGSTGRGVTTITAALNMVVSEVPYPSDGEDLAAIKTGIESLLSTLSIDSQIKIAYPPTNTSLDSWLADYPLTTSSRSANHWMGTAKMGLDSGLVDNGTAVVDLDTRVYGTDNLFVVDASVFPGMVTTNPSALIVAVAEHASEKILALGSASNSNSTSPANGTSTATASASFPSATNGTAPLTPINFATVSSAAPVPSGTAGAGAAVAKGRLACKQWNPYYYQCVSG